MCEQEGEFTWEYIREGEFLHFFPAFPCCLDFTLIFIQVLAADVLASSWIVQCIALGHSLMNVPTSPSNNHGGISDVHTHGPPTTC
jgi:hypothetical protein